MSLHFPPTKSSSSTCDCHSQDAGFVFAQVFFPGQLVRQPRNPQLGRFLDDACWHLFWNEARSVWVLKIALALYQAELSSSSQVSDTTCHARNVKGKRRRRKGERDKKQKEEQEYLLKHTKIGRQRMSNDQRSCRHVLSWTPLLPGPRSVQGALDDGRQRGRDGGHGCGNIVSAAAARGCGGARLWRRRSWGKPRLLPIKHGRGLLG
jgi:hypothetical protein